MNKPILKLLNSYFLRGFFGPFFIIVFPFLLLFIMGNAFYSTKATPAENMFQLRQIVGGILITTIISVGLFNIPMMIIEFKKSTLIKRIGAADISKASFLGTIFIYQIFWSMFSFVWILLWSGVFMGTKPGMNWSVAFPSTLGVALPFIIYSFIFSLALGIMIVSLTKTVQAVMGITNTLYLPISFFSGTFIPMNKLSGSSSLNVISYMVPTKYVVDPFFSAWNDGGSGLSKMGWEAYAYPVIALFFIILMAFISIKKFSWTR